VAHGRGAAQIARVNKTILPPGRLLPADQASATEAEGGKVANILEQMFGPAMLRTTLLLWLVFFNVACIYYVRPPPSLCTCSLPYIFPRVELSASRTAVHSLPQNKIYTQIPRSAAEHECQGAYSVAKVAPQAHLDLLLCPNPDPSCMACRESTPPCCVAV